MWVTMRGPFDFLSFLGLLWFHVKAEEIRSGVHGKFSIVHPDGTEVPLTP